jgi:hypothetical protein
LDNEKKRELALEAMAAILLEHSKDTRRIFRPTETGSHEEMRSQASISQRPL